MAQSPQIAQTRSPNYYQLTGDGISVTYSPDAGPVTTNGPGSFTYQDEFRAITFRGDQIRRTETPDLGVIVSVTLQLTVDAGSTTFSVLLPAVNLPDQTGASAPIRTDGVTTRHSFSLAPVLDRGQRDHYRITPLRGTAASVIVPL